MEVLGRIMRTSGDQAQVAIARDTACGHSCTSCGACQNRELYIQAENPAQYPVGDMVYVEVPDKPPYKIAFVVYILPLLFFLGLCVLFGTVFGVGTVWLGFVIGIAVWYVAMRAMNRKAAQRKTDGVIVRRMTDSVR